MKKFWGVLLTSIISSSCFAGQGPFLLGAIVGDPTGLSGRADFTNHTAIDGAFSWSGGSRTGSQLHGDYLKIKPGAIPAGDTDVDLYYGIGARLIAISSGSDKGKASFGPRVPVGLKHEIKDPSVEFFGEVAFILDLMPSSAADVDIGVGARYRF